MSLSAWLLERGEVREQPAASLLFIVPMHLLHPGQQWPLDWLGVWDNDV